MTRLLAFATVILAASVSALERTGLNGPQPYVPASTIEQHMRCLDLLRPGEVYRLDLSTDRLFQAPNVWREENKALLLGIAAECARRGVLLSLVVNQAVPNQTAYRKHFAAIAGQTWTDALDEALWRTWTTEICHIRLNIRSELFPLIASQNNQAILEVARALGPAWRNCYVEGFNEVGWTIDSEVASRPEIPYGTVAPWVQQFYNRFEINTQGAAFLAGSIENQHDTGATQEWTTRPRTWRFDTENIHVYIDYRPGESMTSWSNRLVAEFERSINRFPDYTGQWAVTEFGSPNIPAELRLKWLRAGATKLLGHRRCNLAIGFTAMAPGVLGTTYGVTTF